MHYKNHCAIRKRRRLIRRKPLEPPQEGEGLKQLLAEKFKEKKKNDPIADLRDRIPKLPRPIYIKKGDGYHGDGLSLTSKNRQVQTLERKYGDEKITGFKICRKPIHSGIRKAIDIITLGKLKEIENEMDYVDTFHLFLYVELENGVVFKIHKNAVVDVEYTSKIPPGSSCVSKMVKPIHTVKEMIMKAEKLNDNLYRYNAIMYNCQNFILSLLKPLGYWTKEIKDFTMQDMSDLFTPVTGAIAQGITDAAGLFSRMIGKGLEIPGEGLKLAGKPKKFDPIEKLREKMGEGLEIPGEGLNTAGNGLKPPSKADINRFLKSSLRKEFKESHGHLDKKHMDKIIKNFSLHKDEKPLKEHAEHLAKQLVKHYFPAKQGQGVGDIVEELQVQIGKLIFKAIKGFISLHKQYGSGKKKKSAGQFFKDVGNWLLKHRKDIAKGVKTAADVGAIVATAMGQAELAAPLKAVSGVAGAIEKV